MIKMVSVAARFFSGISTRTSLASAAETIFLFPFGGGTLSEPTERSGVAQRVQNGLGADDAGARVGCIVRDRAVFSGEDNAALCGGSELQNGRWKGPDGKASTDESDENFAATQCLLSFTVLEASDPASLAANTWSEKRFRVTSHRATPLAQ